MWRKRIFEWRKRLKEGLEQIQDDHLSIVFGIHAVAETASVSYRFHNESVDILKKHEKES